ncbi:hypothetical protein [Nocardiopsis sp. YSL2]|uniref:hypothetical protein n=1 Tax=Nocardiopsis sp. YSL2 TaxID=2939492 RepID=UPI0026F451A2|nr:hypothetical protein [Nocardiopsis sp. YSL2]
MATEPRQITVTRYVCPYCSRGHAKRYPATVHIGRCWKNPDNHGCKTCIFHTPAGGKRGGCIPGQDCDRNVTDESCGQGIDITGGLKTHCPDWETADTLPF